AQQAIGQHLVVFSNQNSHEVSPLSANPENLRAACCVVEILGFMGMEANSRTLHRRGAEDRRAKKNIKGIPLRISAFSAPLR
ncbi:hypothetical protein, partial [Polaromonas sp.]|uniref:hypothetical protein n=1 Tax=Polaromonas sp. TaxID=1869339 RepID=UPI002C5EE206